MSFTAKLLFCGVGLGATGTGLCVEKIVSSKSKNSNFSTKNKFTKMVVNKECRIHKLISSSGNGSFQAIEKEKLEEEIKQAQKGDYQQIKEVCEKLGGKDIFVSNKGQSGWKYYESDQQSSQFKNYLNGLK
ncbi:hypothetical protein MHC_02405 [Mycoplasma haemocanis str. Illinois]|uniref:Uncharacterized protein n=1 Tax=Mycoplasma haemocanis (strain Illinois) TaxID=1111676 RepID=H6N6S3_MYCHN|nr:hypothetical protein [Mycoplasma haemocanis]AEW45345.1 hypothetical protein MHC_02405 [Mycoplasma haemocanis str. Illinois]